jgi:hypothetical protein
MDKNHRKGKPTAMVGGRTERAEAVMEFLANQEPDDNREFVARQQRLIAALAQSMALKQAKVKRPLTKAEIEPIMAEARIRVMAAKIALGNRDAINDLGVDYIESGLQEGTWAEPKNSDA